MLTTQNALHYTHVTYTINNGNCITLGTEG